LQTQETKRKKVTGTLSDGLARVLTADKFFEAQVDFEKEQRNEAKAKEMRKAVFTLPQYASLRRLPACKAMFRLRSESFASWDSRRAAMSKISVSVFGWSKRRGEGFERVIVCVRVEGMVSLDVGNVEEMR
jgi:hypothetical protein